MLIKKLKTSNKVLLLIICFSVVAPCFFVTSVKASSYATETAIIQVRTQKNGLPMCTIQLYTQAQTYSPYPGVWRVINYGSGIFNEFHFQWNFWWIFIVNTKFVYQIIDIDYYEYNSPYIGVVVAGSTWRFKLYERYKPSNYFIFDLQVYVVAGGGTDVEFSPVSSSANGWTHYAEEIDWGQHVEAFLGAWLEANPI